MVADLHSHYPMHVLAGDRRPRLRDALRRMPQTTLRDRLRMAVIWLANRIANLDCIREWTGAHDTAGFGTDLDGFIKPTMGGVETAAELALLEPALQERYGAADAECILAGNARRVVRRVLQARVGK